MDTLPTIDDVREVLVTVLAVEDRAGTLDAGTPLLGSLPELDSMGVVALAVALEERFGIVLEDEDMSAEAFETLGSLTGVVRERAGGR